MTRHLLRLIWNRKRHNVLLALEVLVAFLVLFAVVIVAVAYVRNYRLPLGYSSDHVWVVRVNTQEPDQDPEVRTRHRQTFARLLDELRALPEVVVASAGNTAPLLSSRWTSTDRLADGRVVDYGVNRVTDGWRDTINLELVAGRWFSREDDAAAAERVIINARLAAFIFGTADPIGRTVPLAHRPTPPGVDSEPTLDKRVVGVIRDYRQSGELATPDHFLFMRNRLDDAGPRGDVPRILLVRVRPGTTAGFEEPMAKRLQAVARTWSFEINTLDDRRRAQLLGYLAPLLAVGTVAAFLLIMVVLGLTGVVWQNVTQRTREFGLRRAKGATVAGVRRQVLTELLLLTSLAVAAGAALLVQLPLLPLPRMPSFTRPVFVIAMLLSAAVIALLTLLAGWYPSRLATRIQPAEALHYE